MTHSVDGCRPFPLTTPIIVQWASDQSGQVTEIKVMHRLSNMDFHCPRSIWLWLVLTFKSARNKNQHQAADMAPSPGVISQIPCGMSIVSNSFHHKKKKKVAVFFHIKQAFWVWIYYPSAKSIISRFIKCLICHHGIRHRIDPDQGTHFKVNEVQQLTCDHGNHWFCHVPVTLKQLPVIEQWHNISKTQFWYQLGGNTVQGWGKVLWEAVCALTQN